MAIRKNDYVQFTIKNDTFIGLVTKGGQTPKVVFLREGGKRQIQAPSRHFTVVDSSLAPTELQPAKPISKGTWVSFDDEGTTVKGIVSKGGSVVKVNYKHNGQYLECKGDASCFAPLATKDIPELVTSDVMKHYNIVNHKSLGYGHDSEVFRCDVKLDGKKVLTISNDGWGGENCIDGYTHDVDAFLLATKQWAKSLGGEDKFMTDEFYIEWVTMDKPYGVSDKDYMNKFKK